MGLNYVEKVRRHQSSPLWASNTWHLLNATERVRKRARTVLDFGCGTGRLTDELDCEGCHTVGLDADPAMICEAKALYGSNRVSFQVYDPPRIPYPDGCFDLVVASNVLGHVQDLDRTLDEIARVTRPRGCVAILNANKINRTLRTPMNWLKGYRSDPTIKHRFGSGRMLLELHNRGFVTLQRKYIGEDLFGWDRMPPRLRSIFLIVSEKIRQ